MPVYSKNKVSLIIGGKPITGFSPDSMVEISYTEPRATITVGCQGEEMESDSDSKHGSLKISLLQTSSDNAFLSTLVKTKKRFPWVCRDASGNSVANSLKSRVVQMPALKLGRQAENEYTWEIQGPDLEIFIGGNFDPEEYQGE